MSAIVPETLIDDMPLYKSLAAHKMGEVLDMVGSHGSWKLVKTASAGSSELVSLFTQMLSALNMTASGDAKELIQKMAVESSDLSKNAAHNKHLDERSGTVKIASKSVKDSHYQIDVSKDVIKKAGKKMIMVSCYARDAYLGRYLIKRNYFYTEDRGKSADAAYDEILTKMGAVKDRYLNEVIDVHGIFEQVKQVLDGVVSEIKMEEDSVGTTVKR
jgi:hypothetical protein